MNNTIKRAWSSDKLVSIEDLSGMAFQGEAGGHTFEVSGASSLSGTVTAVFLRADNAAIQLTGSISSGKAVVTLTSDCYTVPGRFLLTIFLTSGGQKVAIYSAMGNVTCTNGTSAGSIPPLVTESIETQTISASGNVTVNGVVDVTNRRRYATLPTANKWYRAFKVPFLSGSSFKISMGVSGDLSREITFCIPNGLNVAFVKEISKSVSNYIDKIRVWNAGSNVLYVDIHATTAITGTPPMVQIEPYGIMAENEVASFSGFTKIESMDLAQTDDSPSGSLLAEYTFMPNTNTPITFSPLVGTADYGGCWYSLCDDLVTVSVGLTGLTNGTQHTIYTLPSNLLPKDQACCVGSGLTNETYPGLYVRSDGKIQVYVPSGGIISAVVTFMRKK